MERMLSEGVVLMGIGLICFGTCVFWAVCEITKLQVRLDLLHGRISRNRDSLSEAIGQAQYRITKLTNRVEQVDAHCTETENALLMMLRKQVCTDPSPDLLAENPFSDLPPCWAMSQAGT